MNRYLHAIHMHQKIIRFVMLPRRTTKHKREVLYHFKGNPRQPEDLLIASDMPTDLHPLAHHTCSKGLQLNFIVFPRKTTPTYHDRDTTTHPQKLTRHKRPHHNREMLYHVTRGNNRTRPHHSTWSVNTKHNR